MIHHLRYLKYVAMHKLYVFQECCKLGIPLAGITHDLSKFLPDEWRPYADYFYAPLPKQSELSVGEWQYASRTREDQRADFDVAWLKHQHRNPHHYQFWVLRNDDGDVRCLPMPDRYRKEMLADWRGAGRAIKGRDETKEWYLKNQGNIVLHPETRRWVEWELDVEGAVPF